MFYYDRNVTVKGIHLVKSNNSKECMISPYWCLNHGFNIHDYVCDGCHDLAMLSVSITDTAIILS